MCIFLWPSCYLVLVGHSWQNSKIWVCGWWYLKSKKQEKHTPSQPQNTQTFTQVDWRFVWNQHAATWGERLGSVCENGHYDVLFLGRNTQGWLAEMILNILEHKESLFEQNYCGFHCLEVLVCKGSIQGRITGSKWH